MGHSLPLFLYFRLFKTVGITCKFLSMAGYEPQIAGDGSNRSTNCATATAPNFLRYSLPEFFVFYLSWWLSSSVTRFLDYFSTFGHLHQWKFAQKYPKFAKVGSKFYQTLENLPKILPKLQNFAKIGSLCSQVYDATDKRLGSKELLAPKL